MIGFAPRGKKPSEPTELFGSRRLGFIFVDIPQLILALTIFMSPLLFGVYGIATENTSAALAGVALWVLLLFSFHAALRAFGGRRRAAA